MSTQRFLQTKFWTEFKARHNWKPYYFSLDENKNFCPVENECDNALCVLVRSFSIKLKTISIAYIPMAPEKNDLQTEEYALLCNKISCSIKNYLPENTICIRYDFPIDFEEISEMNNFCKEFILIAKNNRINIKKSLTSIQPPDTTVLNLTKTEEELLAGMKNKWRYNIKLASKKNVIIEKYNYSDSNFAERFEDFYKLFEITSKRDGVSFHDKNYYLDLFSQSKNKMQNCELPEINLYLAKHEDDYLAGIITLFCKKEAVYLYGASGNIKRNLMASYLLQWTAIKAAKEYGCPVYDFYGIPPVNDGKHPMHGLYLFKTGFGGKIIHRCGSFDFILNKNDYTLYSILEKIRAFYFKKIKKIFR